MTDRNFKTKKKRNTLFRLVISCSQKILEAVVERRTLNKLLSIKDNQGHPLHHKLDESVFSKRLRQRCCLKNRFKKGNIPRAITL